jgi:U3 small nucleolar RNA-associated protein 18
VFVTGRRPFFYLYDAAAGQADRLPPIPGRPEKSWERAVAAPDGRTLALLGNDGYILLYDVQQKACRTTQHLKLNGSVRTVCFAESPLELFASGSDGDVYHFDIRNSRRCVERFSNLDGTISSALAASHHTLAVGAESGVVNLYAQHHAEQRTPLKSILNLKTSVDAMQFNSDGQLLAMASRREKDALKLVHIPSRTVYSNWPTSQTPLGYVWSMDFSPSSRFLALGNDQGKCLLYKLLHYDNDPA